MAFFKDSQGEHFFGIFYYEENGKYNGTFHQLSSHSAKILTYLYWITAAYGIIAFFAETIIFSMFEFFNTIINEDALAFSLFFNSIIISPLALFVAQQRKTRIKMGNLHLRKMNSILVYLTLIFLPIDYIISLIFISHNNEKLPNVPFLIFIFTLPLSIGIYRLTSIIQSRISE